MSTKAEKLVKISLVRAEIFGGICQFLPFRLKRCSCYPRNLRGYLTDPDHICTRCSDNIAIDYFFLNRNCHIHTRFGTLSCQMKVILPILP